MTRKEIRTLFEYNDWANERLMQMLYRAFGEETDLRQSEQAVIRAIQETTTHIIAALAIWRSRWQGTSPTAMLDPAEYPNALALRMAFGAERARFWGFFAGLDTDDRLNEVIAYTNTKGEPYRMPLIQMMQHVINHSSYHRGQVTARLIDMGHEDLLLGTDLFIYYYENQGA